MRTYLVFIRCELGRTYEVAGHLAEIEQAPHVHSVSGEYDLFCMFNLADDADVGRFITDTVQTIPGIRETQTIVCFNPFTSDKGLRDG
ncbi:MAG: Lrp/AsnC ligand binding domain-containing protein [Pseudomonadota bacterium]